MSYQIQINIAHDITLSEFFSILEKNNTPTIIDYIAIGPAGGNPCITLRFSDYDACLGFLITLYNDNEQISFLKSLIKNM